MLRPLPPEREVQMACPAAVQPFQEEMQRLQEVPREDH